MAIDLAQYTKAPVKVDPETLRKLNSQLEELSEGAFAVEELPRQRLLLQKALYTYHRISPEFLRASNIKENPDNVSWWGETQRSISVPKFGVYRLDCPQMEISFGYMKGDTKYFFEVESPPQFSNVLLINLFRSVEPFKSLKSDATIYHSARGGLHYNSWPLPKELRKRVKHFPLTIKSTVHGIFPTDVREKIREAQGIFGIEIFLVAETKPEDWTVEKYVPRFVNDPLLIGVINNDCFYIAGFNTTPLEDYITKEFTEDPKEAKD